MESHRVLIFTQMTRMLDILENFLNYHGYKYLRLDGSTSIEQRQALMERFNNDKRIFCFILSTRSGGIGVNLTGADTVVFYDSDWNPTMDAQAQDRCHRIGQTRDVHIYRLISEKTVEENILKKANQKRLLSDMTIEGGCFTTALLKKHHITELFEDNSNDSNSMQVDTDNSVELFNIEKLTSENEPDNVAIEPVNVENEFEQVLALVEDESDVQATKNLKAEVNAEIAEFDENEVVNTNEGLDANLSSRGEEPNKLELEFRSIETEVLHFYYLISLYAQIFYDKCFSF
jgi:E1A-binding protein p400